MKLNLKFIPLEFIPLELKLVLIQSQVRMKTSAEQNLARLQPDTDILEEKFLFISDQLCFVLTNTRKAVIWSELKPEAERFLKKTFHRTRAT